jgi:hypothetical protein
MIDDAEVVAEPQFQARCTTGANGTQAVFEQLPMCKKEIAIQHTTNTVNANWDRLDLQQKLADLDLRLAKYEKITVREIAWILERHICVEAAGSKRHAKKKYFNFSKLREDSTMKAQLSTVLNSYNLTSGIIERLKDEGTAASFDPRDPDTKELFLALIAGADDDDEDKLQHIALVNAMVTFNMILPDGTISISDTVW